MTSRQNLEITTQIGQLAVLAGVLVATILTSYARGATESLFPAVVELGALDGSDGFVMQGIDVIDFARRAFGAGDVNDDGIDDIIIGAHGGDPNGRDRAGETYLVYGRAGGWPASFSLADLNGINGVVLNGIDPGDVSGISVAGAGDVNADGIDDVIVGAELAEPGGIHHAGEFYVVFGLAGGLGHAFELADLDGINGFRIEGVHPDGYVGDSVSSAGDVNGDGIDDIIAGAFGVDSHGLSDAGESYVVFGRNTGFPAAIDVSVLDGRNGFALRGVADNGNSGHRVSDVGDLNGDGIHDVAISAWLESVNGINQVGRVYLMFGRSAGFPATLDLAGFDGTNGVVMTGSEEFDRVGTTVGGAGDVNNDGIDDMIIGAATFAPFGDPTPHESYVVFGSRAGFPAEIRLAALDGRNGFVISSHDRLVKANGAGDINGDGIDDIIVSDASASPNGVTESGRSHVIFGHSGGFPARVNLSALDGRKGFSLISDREIDLAGLTVGSAGDVNADGIDDLVIAAGGGNVGRGSIYVVFGRGDADGDGIADRDDNCTELENPAQLDADGDGYGNACDPDLNNDCVVNAEDLRLLQSLFLSSNPGADFNGDGVTDFRDFGMLDLFFFGPPGPSGVPADCANFGQSPKTAGPRS